MTRLSLWILLGLFAISTLLLVPFVAPMYSAARQQATAADRATTAALSTERALAGAERFHDIKAAFDTRRDQAERGLARLQSERDPGERARVQTEYDGAHTLCVHLANQYNVDVAKATRAQLRDARLPERLNPLECP